CERHAGHGIAQQADQLFLPPRPPYQPADTDAQQDERIEKHVAEAKRRPFGFARCHAEVPWTRDPSCVQSRTDSTSAGDHVPLAGPRDVDVRRAGRAAIVIAAADVAKSRTPIQFAARLPASTGSMICTRSPSVFARSGRSYTLSTPGTTLES